jgi:hypothetical protein
MKKVWVAMILIMICIALYSALKRVEKIPMEHFAEEPKHVTFYTLKDYGKLTSGQQKDASALPIEVGNEVKDCTSAILDKIVNDSKHNGLQDKGKKGSWAKNYPKAIKIPPGYRVTIYSKDVFTGDKKILVEDVPNYDLSVKNSDGIPFVINSMKIEKNAVAVLYNECDFKGNSKVLTPDGDYSTAEKLNFKVSAIKVPKNHTIDVFTEDGLKGKSASFKGDQKCIDDKNVKDKIKSLKVTK